MKNEIKAWRPYNNCFLLTIPILWWNVLFYDSLPSIFQNEAWNEIPLWMSLGEQISRILLFGITLFMTLQLKTRQQKIGLVIFILGVLIYFESWILLILFPESAWSLSTFGIMGPSWSPVFWLLGVGMIGTKFFIKLPFERYLFAVIVIVFLIFHNLHTFTMLS